MPISPYGLKTIEKRLKDTSKETLLLTTPILSYQQAFQIGKLYESTLVMKIEDLLKVQDIVLTALLALRLFSIIPVQKQSFEQSPTMK